MIGFLVKGGYLSEPHLIKAFELADRKNFVPEDKKDLAYENSPFIIPEGEVITQPALAALLAEFLEPKPGERILEIGTGSGWLTAIIAFAVCGEKTGDEFEAMGKVFSVERSGEIKTFAEKNLESLGLLTSGCVEVIKGNGLKGYRKEAPYDRIISGTAIQTIPLEWKNQLKIGGRIVTPQKNCIVVIEKIGKDEFRKKEFFGFTFAEAKEE